jgi:CHAT domain-containing protein
MDSESRTQIYQRFLGDVLKATNKSNADPKIVYSILRENLDKIDDDCARVLRDWATSTLPRLERDIAWIIARDIGCFGGLILEFPLGNKASNLEIAINAYEIVSTVFTREVASEVWARIQSTLGAAYIDRIKGNRPDNLEKAIHCCQAALQVFTHKTFPKDWGMVQHNLATAYKARTCGQLADNLEQAIHLYQEALRTRTRDAYPKEWADTQNDLGNVYLDRIYGDRIENLDKAIQCYQAALQVYTPDKFTKQYAMTKTNLGAIYCYWRRGDEAENLERAIQCFQSALRVYTPDKFPKEWGVIKSNLGVAYRKRLLGDKTENIEQAIQCFQSVLQVCTRDRLPLDWARTQINLGNSYKDQIVGDKAENSKKGITCYEAALQVMTRQNFPVDWANIQYNLGLAYDNLGQIHKGIECFQPTLEVFTPINFPVNCHRSAFHLGNYAFAAQQWVEAIDYYRIAIEAMEMTRSWASTDTRRQEIQQQAFSTYTNIVQAYINTNQIDKAIEYVERNKARNLVELLANRNLYPKGDIPETVLNELDHLRREIDAEQRRLEIKEIIHNSNSGIISGKRSQPTDTLQATLPARTHLNQLRQQLDELIAREITPLDPNFRLTQKVEPITYNQIQALTDENTAMLEWYITEDKFLTFIITPQSPSPILWQSSKEDLEDLVNWTNEYLKIYSTNRQQWSQDLTSRLQHLAQILHLDKLLSHIPPNCDELVLIPHRFLHLFPLHALPVEVTLAQEGILLDLFPGGVKYAPSCQLLQQAQAKQRSQFSHLFAIQNPTADLTYTDIEVQAIQQHFHPSQILVKGDAKKSAIDNQRLRNAHCVHFSCHGYFNSEQQKSMLSALLLADCCIITPNKPDPTSHLLLQNGTTIDLDKCLTLLDLFTLNLSQCRLVTLSACETGLTDSRYLTDEYIGLNYGFLVAGTASIVCSLWTVNDISTALLIIRFYQNLKSGSTVAVALNQAQLWLRDATTEQLQQWASHLKLASELTERIVQFLDWFDADEQPFQAPYYWAAFCAIGQ